MAAALATLSLAWREALSKRGNFLFGVLIMVLNDLVWVFFWVVVSSKAGDLRGWTTETILLLQAIVATAGGLSLGVFGTSRRIADYVSTGALDPILALPTRTLPQLLCRKIDPVHLGDTVFGLGLFMVMSFTYDGYGPTQFALFAVGVVCATTVITSFLVLLGSISFYSARTEVSESGFHAILLFSAYPIDVFGRVLTAALHLVVPAAFVTATQVEIITEFTWPRLATLIGFSVGIAVLASTAFRLGLRRYTSGAGWITS